MVRNERGEENMKKDRPRMEIVPLWREKPDARLFAEVVVAMARAILLAKQQATGDNIAAKEDGRG